MLGSIDANRGDLLLGWDTDQFPTDLYLTTQCMLVILGQGGLAPGGVNFDAKVRRESFEPVDLFHAHIGGMDAFAHGLKIAAAIRADGVLKDFVKERYGSWDAGIGQKIEAGKADVRGPGKVHAREGRRGQERVGPAGDAGEHHQSVHSVGSDRLLRQAQGLADPLLTFPRLSLNVDREEKIGA